MKNSLLLVFSGIVLGLLVAPAKGSENRKNVLDALEEMKNSATKEAGEQIQRTKELRERSRQIVKNLS